MIFLMNIKHIHMFIRDLNSCSNVFQDVDEAHYGYSFKYLKNKPVKELNGDQFLKMCLAEDEGLLTIDISIDLVGVKG